MLAFVLAVFGASGATTNVASIAALQSAINGAAGDDVFAGKQSDVLAAGDAELVGPVVNWRRRMLVETAVEKCGGWRSNSAAPGGSKLTLGVVVKAECRERPFRPICAGRGGAVRLRGESFAESVCQKA